MKTVICVPAAILLGIVGAHAKTELPAEEKRAKTSMVIPNARDDLKFNYRHVRWRLRTMPLRGRY